MKYIYVVALEHLALTDDDDLTGRQPIGFKHAFVDAGDAAEAQGKGFAAVDVDTAIECRINDYVVAL